MNLHAMEAQSGRAPTGHGERSTRPSPSMTLARSHGSTRAQAGEGILTAYLPFAAWLSFFANSVAVSEGFTFFSNRMSLIE